MILIYFSHYKNNKNVFTIIFMVFHIIYEDNFDQNGPSYICNATLNDCGSPSLMVLLHPVFFFRAVWCVFAWYILDLFELTNRARGPYWGILARGRDSADRAERGPYKNDRGPICAVSK